MDLEVTGLFFDYLIYVALDANPDKNASVAH